MMQRTTLRTPISRRGARNAGVIGCVFLVLAALPSAAWAQKLEIRNKSDVLLGRSRLVDTVTLSDKRYSLGFTNTFREGRALENVFAAAWTSPPRPNCRSTPDSRGSSPIGR